MRWYIKRYAKRVDIKTEFKVNGLEDRLAPEVETTLYRVIQEALTNVARHAQAKKVRLHLQQKKSSVVALIQDDGQGFDVAKILDREDLPGGTGLLGIRERVTLLGGKFNVRSQPGQGTQLAVEIPWENGL